MSATSVTTSAPKSSPARNRFLAVLALAGGLFAAAPAAEAVPFAPAPALATEAAGVTPVQYHGHRHHGWGHRHHGWGHRHHGWGHRHHWRPRHWGHHHGWGHRHHGWGHRHHGWGHRHHGWGHGRHHW